MFVPPCRSQQHPRRESGRSPRSATPRTATTPWRRSKAFDADYGAKWPKAVAKITDAHRGAAGVLRLPRRALDPPAYDQSDRVHLRHRPAAARESPRARAHEPPASQWRSSSSSPHKPAGAPSTHPTSSLWSAPEPSSKRGNSSNGPTNQEVISKSRETRSTSLDYSSHRSALDLKLLPTVGGAMLEICGSAWDGAYLPG